MKKLLLFIIIIILIAFGCFATKKFIDSKKVQNNPQANKEFNDEDSIKYEIEMINKITSTSYNQEEIDQILNRITTKGDYAIVEKAIKQYMKDYITMSAGITETMEQINLNSVLSEENLTTDAPDFINTKTKLSDAKLKFEEYKTNVRNFLTEEKIKSYLPNDVISSEAQSFFDNELAKMTDQDSETLTQLETTIDNANTIIEKEEGIINFLVENKNTWTVKDGAVNFDKDSNAQQYNNLLRRIIINY